MSTLNASAPALRRHVEALCRHPRSSAAGLSRALTYIRAACSVEAPEGLAAAPAGAHVRTEFSELVPTPTAGGGLELRENYFIRYGLGPNTLVVGSHYDTVPGSPGAEDNASGVAINVELSRALRCAARGAELAAGWSVLLAFFVNEEPPHFAEGTMGSRHFAVGARERGLDLKYYVNLDCVGYTGGRLGEGRRPVLLSDPAYSELLAILGLWPEAVSAPRFAPDQSALLRYSDCRNFLDIPGCQAAHLCGPLSIRTPHMHRPTDSPDTLDYPFMAQVHDGLVHVLLQTLGSEMTARPAPSLPAA